MRYVRMFIASKWLHTKKGMYQITKGRVCQSAPAKVTEMALFLYTYGLAPKFCQSQLG